MRTLLKIAKKHLPGNCHIADCIRSCRRAFICICTVGLMFNSFAQTPQKMNYQAVMRNSSGQLLINKTVGLRISILQGSAGGTAVYVETQTVTTNANGLSSLLVGGGTVQSGVFSAIDWGTDNYYIKTEVDPAGGTAYSITSTNQLLSVPYALYSASTANPMVYPGAGIPLSTGTAWGTSITDNSANWNTAYTNRISSLTTTGSSGAATLSSNTLNIPNYTLAGLGGISLSALSAVSPLSYNSSTGAFSIPAASGSQNGYLSSTDWSTFNNKVSSVTAGSTKVSIGGTSSAPTLDVNPANLGTITLTPGTTGSDIAVTGSPVSLGGTLNLNIPDAGATARGVVTTGTQTFAGAKTFSSAPSVSTFSTAGVVHNSAAGLLSSSLVSLTADVSGTLPVGNGGTGTTTAPTQGGIAYGSSASAVGYSAAGTAGYYLTSGGTGAPTWVNGIPINKLTNATGVNTVENSNYTQTWNWSTLSSGNGLSLNSSGTAASNNTQTLLSVSTSGTNAVDGQTTYGIKTNNTHSGLYNTNVGIYALAKNGMRNYALQADGPALFLGSNSNLGAKSLNYLAGTAQMMIGWNKSNAKGEAAFISSRGAGSTGGFAFYDVNPTPLTTDTLINQLVYVSSRDNTNPLALVDIGTAGSLPGAIRLESGSGGSGYVTMQAPSSAITSYTLTLPTVAPSSGQLLSATDGSGTLGWTSTLSNVSIPINKIAAANAANVAIDNTNYTQTWNWSSLSTGSGLVMNYDGLTSGKGLSIASSATALTGSLSSINLTGNNASNTGSLLNINSSGASSLSQALKVNVASTGNLSSGGVNFGFAAHTGNGFQLDDATTSGNAMLINTGSLTTGTGLTISGYPGTGTCPGKLLAISSQTTANLQNGAFLLWLNGDHQSYGQKIYDVTTTGTALYIQTDNLTTGNGLSVNSSSTGNLTTGAVRFNLSGAHTGSGVRIDDVTLTGTAVDINAGSLTTGTALDVTAAAGKTAINATGDIKSTRYLLTTPTSITGASTNTLDVSTGNVFTISLAGSISSTLSFSNTTSGSAQTFIIKLAYSGTGNSITWPAGVKWSGGTAPTLTNVSGKVDIISVISDGEGNYYCTYALNF